MSKLIIARHHESQWNKLGQWTGTRDVHLTDYGFQKSEEMAELIRGIHIDQAFASMQVRSIETLSSMLTKLEMYHVPTTHSSAINERDYGDYTGKNKWEMEKILGSEFDRIRREWDYPIPNGESLKMVYERAVPFYIQFILPFIAQHKNVLVVSHGNAIRALIKYIEHIADEDMIHIEMPFGAILIYEMDKEGKVMGKEIRTIDSKVNA